MVFGQPSFRLGPPGRRSRGGMYKEILHALLGRFCFCLQRRFLSLERILLLPPSLCLSLCVSLSFIVAFLFRFFFAFIWLLCCLFRFAFCCNLGDLVFVICFFFLFFLLLFCCVTVENLARRVKNKTHIVPGSYGWEWTC